ncbi:hypothetical protein M422DRAFT_266784 [Sphaerobolus stellatus SS14]|uniref:Unplaced genomic scaffold SPHSTscaffold_166, whole genome shotgun sequence n=1 Tax=Sphaerobolus stellatus (strain SS14) TaxID=990650 RepID=A0A0C9V1T0_SPHS4|nr:hypothetical protein M422DRAFT_266784 [Sphaerobolus stellatus SS14]
MGGPDGTRVVPLGGDGSGVRRVMMFPRLSNLLATPPGGPAPNNGTGNVDVPRPSALQALVPAPMNTGGPSPEPPTPEDVINSLLRVVLRSDRPVFGETCSICREAFDSALAAPPDVVADLTSSSTVDSKAPELSPVPESDQE